MGVTQIAQITQMGAATALKDFFGTADAKLVVARMIKLSARPLFPIKSVPQLLRQSAKSA
jgi:hypothetical protein